MALPNVGYKNAGLIYPIELFVGCVIAWFLGENTLEKQRKEWYLLSSGNIVNKFFAYRGNLVWTVVFVCLAYVQIYTKCHTYSVLPRDARTMPLAPLKGLLIEYACKFIIKNLMLMIIFFFIDTVFVLTGGSCVNGTVTRSAERCRTSGGDWVGGFDISGHFCFLVNISMILWIELSHFQRYLERESLLPPLNRWFRGIVAITVGVLAIWIFMLMVTSIYYHTVLEKLIGCAMGYICPFVIYWVLPRFAAYPTLRVDS